MLSLLIRLHERSRMRLHKRSRMRSRKHSNVHFYVSAFSVHCLRMRNCASDSQLTLYLRSWLAHNMFLIRGLRIRTSTLRQRMGSRTFTFARLRFCFSSALFVGIRKKKPVASCACAQNFAFATATQLRTCKHRRRRLHKTIRSQTHVDVHANVDARSVAFSRARPLCGQSLPLLPIATAGAFCAPASLLVSLRSQKEKAAVKNSCKVPLEERIRILIRIHIRILIFIRIRIKISSIFVL